MTYDHGVTKKEIEMFKNIRDIEVVFDIGAKDNIEYLELKPDLIYHLFEPNPVYFEKLKKKIKEKGYKNVTLNNFGIGVENGALGFSTSSESFDGSSTMPYGGGELMLPIRSLDWYIKENSIIKIDFIKIDTEGFDYKIVEGNPRAIKLTKYLQYEFWEDRERFKALLENDFALLDLGDRNVFCTRK